MKETRLEMADVTESGFKVLSVLEQSRGRDLVRIGQIATKTGISHTTVRRLLQRFEVFGLVEDVVTDKSRHVVLTRSGLEFVKRIGNTNTNSEAEKPVDPVKEPVSEVNPKPIKEPVSKEKPVKRVSPPKSVTRKAPFTLSKCQYCHQPAEQGWLMIDRKWSSYYVGCGNDLCGSMVSMEVASESKSFRGSVEKAIQKVWNEINSLIKESS